MLLSPYRGDPEFTARVKFSTDAIRGWGYAIERLLSARWGLPEIWDGADPDDRVLNGEFDPPNLDLGSGTR